MSGPENKAGSFRVVDRRRFDDAGNARDDADITPERATTSPPTPSPTPVPSAAPATPVVARPVADTPPPSSPPRPATNPFASAKPTPTPSAAPAIDFGHFCLSLATSAQIAMGLVQQPGSAAVTRNLPAARQTIDILDMLQQKTTGNLSAEDTQLLEEILYTLRMQYVEATKGP